eukprot:281582_1
MQPFHECYFIGQNNDGQMGNGTAGNINKLTRLERLRNIRILDIKTGDTGNTYVLCDKDRLLVHGYNQYGVLSILDAIIPTIISVWREYKRIPNEIINLITMILTSDPQLKTSQNIQYIPACINKYRIKLLSGGIAAMHRFILTKSNKLYAVGWNGYSQLTFNDGQDSKHVFCEIKHFKNNQIILKQIECTLMQTIFLSADGNIYLSTKSRKTRSDNNIYKLNINENIIAICCGKQHTLVLSEKKQLFGFGINSDFQLGKCKANTFRKPSIRKGAHCYLITYFAQHNIYIEQIQCGFYHSMVLSTDNKIYCFGANYCRQCADTDDQRIDTPLMVNSLMHLQIKEIKCGGFHNVVCAEENSYYLWGDNEFNQCLVYHESDYIDFSDGMTVGVPTKYNLSQDFENVEIVAIYPGEYETRVVVKRS